MDTFYIILAIYLVIINLLSVFITIKDKRSAKKQKLRVPEKTLFFFSLIGGSISMYATMKLIRHKTQHKRFMIGIPAIIVLQVVLVVIFMMFGENLWLK